MSLIVQKYGGTSVGTPERIINVARKIIERGMQGHQVIAVVSAMAGVTNRLIELAEQVTGENKHPTEREMDVLLATGEQTTIALTAMALNALGAKAVSLTGAQAGIETDGVHTKARISNISPAGVNQPCSMTETSSFSPVSRARLRMAKSPRSVAAGSDLTAIAMAAAIDADLCQIFTDVDGVYTCDPRVVPDAKSSTRSAMTSSSKWRVRAPR
jgi:aspartate kinase